MTEETEKYLFDRYKDLISDNKLEPINMFKFECSNGWFDIIDLLCKQIKSHLEYTKNKEFKIVQVKEKFGGLCFYYDNGDEYIRGMVSYAMQLSYHICEECGTMNDVGRTSGWIKTICKECVSKDLRLLSKWKLNE